MAAEVLVDVQNRIAVVTVSDPARRNALSVALSEQLAAAVKSCERNNDVHAIVITGAPPAFCAGADLAALEQAREHGDEQLRRIYAGFRAVADCFLPTVAAVNGAAVGAGLNLALACDVRLASAQASFDTRFLQLGIHPGGGMSWMLHRIVGPQTAAAMALCGQVLSAVEAERVGLVWRAVPGGETAVLAAAVELVDDLAEVPRNLIVDTKKTMQQTAIMTDSAQAVELELQAQVRSVQRPEFATRLAALKARIGRG